ncbi:hypothetical protein [Microbacterium pullorum]|nr:hypothetical protein [Microbacterium pullorum]
MSSADPQHNKPSPARVLIWLVVGAIGVYFLASGIIGIIAGGG